MPRGPPTLPPLSVSSAPRGRRPHPFVLQRMGLEGAVIARLPAHAGCRCRLRTVGAGGSKTTEGPRTGHVARIPPEPPHSRGYLAWGTTPQHPPHRAGWTLAGLPAGRFALWHRQGSRNKPQSGRHGLEELPPAMDRRSSPIPRKVDSRSKSGFDPHGHLEQSSNLSLFSLLFHPRLPTLSKKSTFLL